MRRAIVLTVVAISGLAATAVLAGPWGPGMGPRSSAVLGLTADQSASIQTMDQVHWNQIAPLQNDVLAKREELRQLMTASEPDRDAVLAKQKEVHEIQGRIRELDVQHQLDRRALLTPEQQQNLPDLGRLGYRGGRGRGGPRW